MIENSIKNKTSEESFLLMNYLDKKSDLNSVKKYLTKDFLYNIEKLDQELSSDKKKDDKYLYLELIRLINIKNYHDKKSFIIKLKKERSYIRKAIFKMCRSIKNNNYEKKYDILLFQFFN